VSNDTVASAENFLRERRPTAANADELLEMLRITRSKRRDWITTSNPTISDIFKRYPRLMDVPNAVS
jgi:hypothetical protein